ncbi:MAG: DUF3888 domain-containing protein, partial [Firmicutes bacterium]|nr:DUF3888 domain-containing protein [Bacillota bacterium]
SEISNDMMIAILRDYISLAIRGRYHVSSTFGVSVEPHMIEILDLQRLGKGVAHGFLVQVKVKPHTEANQQIGEDHLTFQISNGYVRLLEFKHVQDLPIANTINNGG